MLFVLDVSPKQAVQTTQGINVEARERIAITRSPEVLESAADGVQGLNQHPLFLPVRPDQLDQTWVREFSFQDPITLDSHLVILPWIEIAQPGSDYCEIRNRKISEDDVWIWETRRCRFGIKVLIARCQIGFPIIQDDPWQSCCILIEPSRIIVRIVGGIVWVGVLQQGLQFNGSEINPAV